MRTRLPRRFPNLLGHAWAVVFAAAAAAMVLCAQTLVAPPSRAGALAPLGPGFLWGVAASGFQSEGHAPDSNWNRYIAANPTYDRLGNSVDFTDNYGADIDRAAALGVRVYRIGIEWARLQPTPGGWDQGAFRYYDAVISRIRKAGMQPMLTLDHWVYPGWEAARGGWRNPRMAGDWEANMRAVVDRYAKDNPLWVTVNEPVAYIAQESSHGAADPHQMLQGVARVHNAAYDYIHHKQPGARVTSNFGYVAGSEAQVDGELANLIGGRLDFVGVDYYFAYDPIRTALDGITRSTGSASGIPGAQIWDLPVRPEGIYYALQFYARRFPGKPLYIVENGLPTNNGAPRSDGYSRSDHLRDTVYWLQRAKADGMNLIGYNYWSLTDNYEWGSYTPRFGLYTVDVRTDPSLTRRPTDAVAAYTGLIHGSGVPLGYRPTRPPSLCQFIDPPNSCTSPAAP